MTDQDFEKLLKQKLENFEADVPNSCWDVVSQALPPLHKPQRAIIWRRMAVAAVLVMAVSLTGFLFLKNEKSGQIIAKANHNKIYKEKQESKHIDEKPKANLIALANNRPIAASAVAHKTGIKTGKPESKTATNNSAIQSVIEEKISDKTAQENSPANNDIAINQTNNTSDQVKISATATDKEIEAFINEGIEAQKQNSEPTEIIESKKANSLTLMAGLPTSSHSSSDNEFHPLRSASAFEDAYNILTSNVSAAPTAFERRHSIPFSMGVLVGKEILKNTTLETGLHYTYLRSEQLQTETLNEIQKLYYLGIPLSLTYKYGNYKRLSFYAKMGGMVEKNVAGKWIGEINGKTDNNYSKSDTKLEERLQWSIHSGIGINYKLSKLFYFYLEPSFTYFPDNGSEYQNIRKKEKFELSLQGGIRAIFASK